MKPITKLSLVAAAASVIALGSAFADDPQLQNRLAQERMSQKPTVAQKPTIALYGGGHGIAGRAPQDTSTKTRFELRSNPHGQTFGVYVSVAE